MKHVNLGLVSLVPRWEDVLEAVQGDELRLGVFRLRYGLPHGAEAANAGPRAACYFAR
jgi:hypothetical protein